ncbi:hypothetical protein FRC07_014474, partial [Ceratobasidium sp. 392]
MPLLYHIHPGVRKRAIDAIASFVSYISDPEAQAFVASKIVPSLFSPDTANDEKCATLDLLSALARHATPSVDKIIPRILDKMESGNEVLKASGLQALEKLTTECPGEMKPHTQQLIKAGVKCAEKSAYKASYNGVEHEDDNVEEEDENSDIEDVTCMVRRPAIKLLGAIIGARLETLDNLYKVVMPVLQSSSLDIEATIRYAAWSASQALVARTRQFFSDPSNFIEEDAGRFEPLLATKDLLAVVNSVVPKLLKGMAEFLSPSSTISPSALELFDTLLSPLPKGGPMTHVFSTGYEGAIDSQEDLVEDLFLLLAQPTTLVTFSHMMSVHDLPCTGRARIELTALMTDPDTSIASTAIHIGLRALEDMSASDHEDEFVLALQTVARRALKDSSPDAGIRDLGCKIISALMVHNICCDDEDWDL